MSRAFVNENVRKRARQRAMVMQAEVDRGQAETTPAFIEPAQLKAGVHTGRDNAGREAPASAREARNRVTGDAPVMPRPLESVLNGPATNAEISLKSIGTAG
jgi:hypothetical protein